MRVVTLTAAAAIAMTLSGCVTSKQFTGPNGQPAYSIRCNGMANTWGDCLAKAGEICGAQGYTILERNGEAVNMAFASGYANPTSASFSAAGGTGISRSIVASCGNPQASSKPAGIFTR